MKTCGSARVSRPGVPGALSVPAVRRGHLLAAFACGSMITGHRGWLAEAEELVRREAPDPPCLERCPAAMAMLGELLDHLEEQRALAGRCDGPTGQPASTLVLAGQSGGSPAGWMHDGTVTAPHQSLAALPACTASPRIVMSNPGGVRIDGVIR